MLGQHEPPARGPTTPAGGVTVWLTGRPASGKTTVAMALEVALRRAGVDSCRIDGDDLRQGPCRDLGYSREDRAENVRRAGVLALEAARVGRVAIASLISPYGVDRQRVRDLHQQAGLRFVEVHVDCPIAVAERRDPKRLYRRARAGDIRGVTGIDDPYEIPAAPEVVLDTSRLTIQQETQLLLAYLDMARIAVP